MHESRISYFPAPGAVPSLTNVAMLGAAVVLLAGVARAVVHGWGNYAVAASIVAVLYLLILARWQRGVYALLVYLPFAGAVSLALFPWDGPAALNPVLYKDWLFLLPAYAGFLGALLVGRVSLPPLWRLPSALLLGLSLLVVAQMANPGVPNIMVAFIGAKVWLFYLPLFVLTPALVTTRRELTLLLRLLVVMAVIPCGFGILEYVLAQLVGYREVMLAIYGAAAETATQDFTHFEVAGGWIQRIPSTFTFLAQYFSFTLAMMVPCYALGRVDPSPRWRRFARWMLVVTIMASLLSGSRAAFIFAPLLLALMYAFDRGSKGLFRAAAYLSAAAGVAFAASWANSMALYEHISWLFGYYAQDTAYGGLIQAITSSPLGSGTGTNTGAARYAIDRPELFTSIENYYAKAAYELGVVGLLLVWALFAALIWRGWKVQRRLVDPGLRSCGAALLAFLVTLGLYCFKGWVIDLDPINVYFWMFAGLLAKLPSLDSRPGSLDKAAL